jgi:heme-degrading monooxygenase HmoA
MVATSSSDAAVSPVRAAERYVATNRFQVKEGREAAFEKRWADRKSRLGLLDGFRFFCMMRRVQLDGARYADDINYISCTVWETVCIASAFLIARLRVSACNHSASHAQRSAPATPITPMRGRLIIIT